MIRSCPVQPISIRMKISNYDRIMKGQSAEHWDDPYYPMLHLALMSTPLLMERFGGDHQLGFVFDTHQKFKRTSEGPRYYQSLLPILGDRVSPNVHYENDEDFPPLQAADLLAWQVRRSLCATQEAPRRHLRDLKTTIDPRFPIEELEVSQELMETWIRKYGEYVFDLVRAYKAQLGDGERES